MRKPRLAHSNSWITQAYRRLERNLDKLRRLLPTNYDLKETEFLPAVLELVETPPSPLGRGLLYTICSLLVIALIWAYFGKVDLVATAQGHIIPSGKVKIIQPLEIGVISRIDAVEGQAVKKGDLLVEIDSTESRADAQRLTQERAESQADTIRLSVMARANGRHIDPEQTFLSSIPADYDPMLAQHQLQLMREALSQQTALLAGIDSDIARKKSEHAQALTEIAKLNATLPLIRKRSNLKQQLLKQGYASQLDASKELQLLYESENDLTEAKQKLEQTDAASNQLVAQRQEAVAKFSVTTLSSLAEAQRKLNDTEQQLIKAKDLAGRRMLTAPVDGVVQQLAIHTIGGVVTPAQELMVVVPKGAILEVEAMISNGDVGFVRQGQQAEIKVETFPFTRYGLRHGTILDLSCDAIAPANQQPRSKNGTGAASQTDQESQYTARLSLDQDTMQVEDQSVPLTPGMQVTAEIKTGRQRILDYMLDPLRRYKHDSFQER